MIAVIFEVVPRPGRRDAYLEIAAAPHRTLESIQQWTTIVDVDLELAARASWFKLRGGISYADCFAAALAHRDGFPLITGDPEFRRVEDVVRIAWLDSFG